MRDIFKIFDGQLIEYRDRLFEIGLSEWQVRKPSTSVYEEVVHFRTDIKSKIVNSSPVPVKNRLIEIDWFIYFNAKIGKLIKDPGFARAYTIVSNYFSFVYLGDTVFRILAESSDNSASMLLGKYLRGCELGGFRHALAHGHWTICDDGSGIKYWPHPRAEGRFVSQSDLIFWYTLARATGYAALSGAASDAG